nr:MAG TPA: Stress-inducible humoral factor Turandot [Caudoviricetes sp.]
MSTDYRTCECGETFADCADGVVFCRGDDFGDKELLEFVTSAIGVSRDDLVNFYKRYKTELKNDKACRLDGFISSTFINKDSGTGKGFVLGGLVGRFESIHE